VHAPSEEKSDDSKGRKGLNILTERVFSNFPPNIINLFCDAKRFKSELGKYLHLKSLYTIEK